MAGTKKLVIFCNNGVMYSPSLREWHKRRLDENGINYSVGRLSEPKSDSGEQQERHRNLINSVMDGIPAVYAIPINLKRPAEALRNDLLERFSTVPKGYWRHIWVTTSGQEFDAVNHLDHMDTDQAGMDLVSIALDRQPKYFRSLPDLLSELGVETAIPGKERGRFLRGLARMLRRTSD